MKLKPADQIALAAGIVTYIEHNVVSKELIQTKLLNGTTASINTGYYTDSVQGTFVQISDKLPQVSAAGMKLIFEIIKDLVLDNYLWYFDHRQKKNFRKAIKELREKRIIVESVGNVHIVNPLLIRKGNVVKTVENTFKCIIQENGICREAILTREQMKRSKVNPAFHISIAKKLTDAQFTPVRV